MSDKMREEFEQFAVRRGYSIDKDAHGFYVSVACWSSFEAWKASRAALVVNITIHEEFDKRMYASNVYMELDKSGISYE